MEERRMRTESQPIGKPIESTYAAFKAPLRRTGQGHMTI
jgi:hypothetical protein